MPKLRMSSLTQRKKASQERAEATVGAIVEAAARILQSDGVQALTTNHIARVAGVSIGSVYQYFPNKEAIVVALIDAQLRADKRLFSEVVAALHAAPVKPNVKSLVAAVTAHVCENQYRVAKLLAALLPLLSQLRQEQLVAQRLDEMGALLETLLIAHVDELRPQFREPELRKRTIRVLADAIRGALNAAVHEPQRLLSPEFQSDVCALALGLLQREDNDHGR